MEQVGTCREQSAIPQHNRLDSNVIGEHRHDGTSVSGRGKVAATAAPRSVKGSALVWSRFQTVTWWPAATRLAAIPEPIFPSPMNPSSMSISLCVDQIGNVRDQAGLARRNMVGHGVAIGEVAAVLRTEGNWLVNE